jgi:hypothetical protein
VFGNRVLRRIFGYMRKEVTRDWRKLHNEELHNLYQVEVFWVLMSCIVVVEHERFGGTRCQHLQGEEKGDRIKEEQGGIYHVCKV